MDIELGEYLRALITADRALVPDDPFGCRDAFIGDSQPAKSIPLGSAAFPEMLMCAGPQSEVEFWDIVRDLDRLR